MRPSRVTDEHRDRDLLPNENWKYIPVKEWPYEVSWNLPIRRKTHEQNGLILLFLHEIA